MIDKKSNKKGRMYVNLFFILLFVNISLALAVPEKVLGDSIFFDTNKQGEYTVSSDFQNKFENADPSQNEGFLDPSSTVFSGLFLLFDFLGLLFKVLFSSLFIVFELPSIVALIVGVPVYLAYGLALIDFIRG